MNLEGKLERLAAAGIQILPAFELGKHIAVERNGFVALCEKREDNVGRAGSAGLLTDAGFAVLVWRGEAGWFVAKGYERPASAAEVDALRRFTRDLEEALAD